MIFPEVFGTLRFSQKGLLKFLFPPEQLKHVVDKDGHWVVRDDVWIWYFDRKGGLKAGLGARDTTIVLEFGFGHFVGEALDDQILLIKTAWDGKSCPWITSV